MAGIGASNLWALAERLPDTIRCTTIAEGKSYLAAVVTISAADSGAKGQARVYNYERNVLLRAREITVATDDWSGLMARAASAVSQTARVKEQSALSGRYTLLELVKGGQYSARAASIPDEEESGRGTNELCSRLVGTDLAASP